VFVASNLYGIPAADPPATCLRQPLPLLSAAASVCPSPLPSPPSPLGPAVQWRRFLVGWEALPCSIGRGPAVAEVAGDVVKAQPGASSSAAVPRHSTRRWLGPRPRSGCAGISAGFRAELGSAGTGPAPFVEQLPSSAGLLAALPLLPLGNTAPIR
jgi:hypothetical protein